MQDIAFVSLKIPKFGCSQPSDFGVFKGTNQRLERKENAVMEKSKDKKRYPLTVLVALLMLLSFLTGVLASGLLLKTSDNTPVAEIEIDLSNPEGDSEESASSSEQDMESEGAQAEDAAEEDEESESSPVSGQAQGGNKKKPAGSSTQTVVQTTPLFYRDPKAVFQDAEGRWKGTATVQIMKAQYDENGDVTVKSAYGDKVVAPGTANSYYFDIKNTGNTSIHYNINTETVLEVTAEGQTYTVPMEARFYDYKGRYLLGTENSYADMAGLDGLATSGNLSPKHYARYFLDWRWPFEGNDELDTMLGNLSAESDSVVVTVKINMTATGTGGVEGGEIIGGGIALDSVQTGDSARIGLWVCLCMMSGCMLILLLFARRRGEEDEEA